MTGLVPGALEYAEEDESCRDRGVEDAEEDQGRDHERERDLLVELVAKRAERRGGIILVASVGVDDPTNTGEDDDLRDRHGPERLGKVPGVFHLGDEAGQGDLPNERVRDVQESVHGGDKGHALDGQRSHNRLTPVDARYRVNKVGVWVVASGVVLDPGENCCQQDGDEREECRCRSQPGEGAKGSWERENEADDGTNNRKDDGTLAVVGDRIEVLGCGEDVKAL
jgi:hypothetical protein